MDNEKNCIEWKDYEEKFLYWKQVVRIFGILEELEKKQKEDVEKWQKSIQEVYKDTQRTALDFLRENPEFGGKGQENEGSEEKGEEKEEAKEEEKEEAKEGLKVKETETKEDKI